MRPLLILFWLTAGVRLLAQDYYYNSESGQRFSLRADLSATALVISGTTTPEAIRASLAGSPGQTVTIMKDETRSMLVTTDENAANNQHLQTFYAEIQTAESMTMASYQRQSENFKAMPEVLRVLPCFRMEGGERACLSDHLYVKLKDERDLSLLYDEAASHHLEVLGRDKHLSSWFTLACTQGSSLNALEAANLFFESHAFAGAEPEFVYQPKYESSDPDFGQQWGLKNTGQFPGLGSIAGIDVKAESAWTLSKGKTASGVRVKVGIFDSGVLKSHPDLAPNWQGENNSSVSGAHGTAVAGIVGAVQNNNNGGSGVAPEVALYSITAAPYDLFTPLVLVNSLGWAIDNDMDILNMSYQMGYSQMVKDAIANVLTQGRNGKGIVVAASAGNQAYNMDQHPHYPSSYLDDILVVGAINMDGNRATFSNFGSELDIVAPGVHILTTNTGSGPTTYGYFEGTSMSTPFVSGVAALVLSLNPDLTARQVNHILEQTAGKVRKDQYTYSETPERNNGRWNKYMGYGLLNAYDACLMALSAPCNLYQPVLKFSGVVYSGTPPFDGSANHIVATAELQPETETMLTATSEISFEDGFTANQGSTLETVLMKCVPAGTVTAGSQTPGAMIASEPAALLHPISYQTGLTVSPNPFGNEMNVTYTLDAGQIISLHLGDVMGVGASSVIFSGYAEAGTHSVTVNAASLPTGIYVVKLSTPKGIQAVRIVRK